jgi:hypothetical protein
MNDQNKDIIIQFGKFALKIRGNVMDNINSNEIHLIKKIVGLNINKRDMPKVLGDLFDTYDGVTAPYELYYNITSGQVNADKNVLNGMILRTLCCDGDHEKEKEFLVSCDAVSENIKSIIRDE